MRPAHLRWRLAAVVLAAGGVAACNLVFSIEPGTLGPAGKTTSSSAGGAGGSPTSGPGGGNGCTGGAPMHGSLAWLQGSDPQQPDHVGLHGEAVAFGLLGNAILAGSYAGPVMLGGKPLPYTNDNSFSTDDLLLAAFGARDGRVLWAEGFSGPGDQIASSVAVDPSNGEIVVTGHFQNTFTIGPDTLTSAGGDDIFVARFGAAGKPRWARRYGDAGDQGGTTVVVDRTGAAVVAAVGYGVFPLGPGQPRGAQSDAGLYLVKIDAEGQERWSRYYHTGNGPSGYGASPRVGLALDANDGVVVATANGGASPVIAGGPPLRAYGAQDVIVLGFNAAGDELWGQSFGGTAPDPGNGDQWATSVAISPCGDLFMTGGFQRDLKLGGTVLHNKEPLDPSGMTETADIFVTRLDRTTGAPLWAKAYGDGGNQQGWRISAGKGGDLLVTGVLVDDARSTGIDFGDGHLWPPTGLSGENDYRSDLFILLLSASGGTRFSKRAGDREYQEALDSALDPSGAALVAGHFDVQLSLDNSPNGSLQRQWVDLFVARYGP